MSSGRGERALRVIVFTGVAVVKLAPTDESDSSDDDVFLRGGSLRAAAAEVLARCLARFGSPPGVVDPQAPTAVEVAAIRRPLQPFQTALAAANANRIARR